MDVWRLSFFSDLLEVLCRISEAHFVSIDLEMSGISSKKPNRGKLSLEELYQETKEAANRYIILQVGLTCVQEDVENGKYILRPFNFFLSPLVEERLDIERIFSFQSGAVEFLLNQGFQMELPYSDGVPYLSRDEEKFARHAAYERIEGASFEDIEVKVDDVQALEFVKKTRDAIAQWRDAGKPRRVLDIMSGGKSGNFEELFEHEDIPAMSRFEKRLVHQLVRAEFPDCVTISKSFGVRIIPFDEERENAIRNTKKQRVNDQIERQVGFRWIIEALIGGEINIDPKTLLQNSHSSEHDKSEIEDVSKRLADAKERLKIRRPPLVGHNLFTDLVYTYRTFWGSLPSCLNDFQSRIHENFPLVIDTKYLATHDGGDYSSRSALDQLARAVQGETLPHIELDRNHQKYLDEENYFHEAGFDSYMTAIVLLRLCHRLQNTKAEASQQIKDDQNPDGDVKATISTAEERTDGTENHTPGVLNAVAGAVTNLLALSISRSDPPPETGNGEEAIESSETEKRNTSIAENDAANDKANVPGLIPDFESSFWATYCNKLRIFAAQEGMMHLPGLKT